MPAYTSSCSRKAPSCILVWKSPRSRKWYSRPLVSPGRGLRVVALTEKANCSSMTESRCFTTVVLPDPEGAEKMMSFSKLLQMAFRLVKVGILVQKHQIKPLH